MKKRIILLLIAAFIFAVGAGGCYYDNSEVLYPVLANQCDTTSVTYSKNISRILSIYCYSCHSSTYQSTGGGIKLDTYNDLMSHMDRLIGAINHEPMYTEMPKDAGKLSECVIRQFMIWQENGSLNN